MFSYLRNEGDASGGPPKGFDDCLSSGFFECVFVISIAALKRNTAILRQLKKEAGCGMVLALKAFSCWKAFAHIVEDLDGCCASGLWEAKLATEKFGKKVLTYSPAYDEADISELCEFTHHLDFNSLNQWQRYRMRVMNHPRYRTGELRCGLRINPECSTSRTPIYDPCVSGSRLGITADQLPGAKLEGISSLHFHTLCEQNSGDLEKTLRAVDEKFGDLLRSEQIKSLNMGGGHWMTKPDYDRELLIRLIHEARQEYQVEVWLEPGEAVAIHCGVLRATVLDVFESGGHRLAILNVSATAHMPDVIEMPYRPNIFLVDDEGDGEPAVRLEGEHYQAATEKDGIQYRLGGPTCLAGDVIGDYAFSRKLKTGDILVIDDMAHYTMVKTSTFNGVKHPSIALQHEGGHLEVIREFSFEDFRNRLS